MDKRKVGIISVITSTLICGLPGLAGMCVGSLAIFGVFMPDNGIPSNDRAFTISASIALIGLSIAFVAIPILVGAITLWEKKVKIDLADEPIPEEDF
jgi:hypothetical protein